MPTLHRATATRFANEWESATDPGRMVEMLRRKGGVSDRKWRLFVAAFWRWQAVRLNSPPDLLARAEVMSQWAETGRLPRGKKPSRSPNVIFFSSDAARSAELTATAGLDWDPDDGGPSAIEIQPRLLRELFGNPFRPPPYEARWNSTDVLGVARGISEEQTFDRLPILADALMDAGCSDSAILGHCHGPGPHVRGCWVVDLVLGRG